MPKCHTVTKLVQNRKTVETVLLVTAEAAAKGLVLAVTDKKACDPQNASAKYMQVVDKIGSAAES